MHQLKGDENSGSLFSFMYISNFEPHMLLLSSSYIFSSCMQFTELLHDYISHLVPDFENFYFHLVKQLGFEGISASRQL